MAVETLTAADAEKAQAIWAEYQKTHDVSARKGQAVGIDPATGRVWFGPSARDIAHQMQQQAVSAPLVFLRVGYSYYVRKGGRR